jgi:hypothetical protein
MVKNNFKSLLLMTFIAVCFSSNLFAMQEYAEKQTDKSSPLLHEPEDAFIREFVEKINKSKVQYDGKTLRLYMDTRSNMSKPLIFMAASLFLGFTCLLKSENRCGNMNKELGKFGLISAYVGLASVIYISLKMLDDLFTNAKLTPFLAIDREQIETRNKIKMKWTDASIMKFLNDNSIMLCNKDGIPLFVIDNNNLPIKLSELIVILGSYLKEYGAKKKELHA